MTYFKPSSRTTPAAGGTLAAICALALSLLSAAPLAAQDVPADMVRARLVEGWRTGNGTEIAAVKIDLADGWKTYWRAPGEAGIPPVFDWSGSDNVAAVAYHWPVPMVFDLNGMRTIGYKHELVLPVEVTPKDPSQPIRLEARVDMGVCRDICVPVSLRLATTKGEDVKADIRAALDRAPVPAKAAGLRMLHCSVEPIRDGLRLTASIDIPGFDGQGDAVAVFESSDPGLWLSEATTRREGGKLVTTTDILPTGRMPVSLDRSRVTITLLGQDRAVEIEGCPR